MFQWVCCIFHLTESRTPLFVPSAPPAPPRLLLLSPLSLFLLTCFLADTRYVT